MRPIHKRNKKSFSKISTLKVCRYDISEIVHQTIKACNISNNFFIYIKQWWLSAYRSRWITHDREWRAELQDWRAQSRMWFMSTNWLKYTRQVFTEEMKLLWIHDYFPSHTSCIHGLYMYPKTPGGSSNSKICIYTQIIYIQYHCIGTDKKKKKLKYFVDVNKTKKLNI